MYITTTMVAVGAAVTAFVPQAREIAKNLLNTAHVASTLLPTAVISTIETGTAAILDDNEAQRQAIHEKKLKRGDVISAQDLLALYLK